MEDRGTDAGGRVHQGGDAGPAGKKEAPAKEPEVDETGNRAVSSVLHSAAAPPPADVPTDPASSPGPSSRPVTPAMLRMLQRSAGNAAAQSLVRGERSRAPGARQTVQRDTPVQRDVAIKDVSVTTKVTTPGAKAVRASAVPANATDPTFNAEKPTVEPTNVTVDGKTGSITVADGQEGGEVTIKATTPDGGWASAPLRIVEKPSGIASTSTGSETDYGGEFTHTFSTPSAKSKGAEGANVNEKFDSKSATMPWGGSFALKANRAGSHGWDVNSAGAMAGPDTVDIDASAVDVGPYVPSTSNPTPKTLPAEFTMTQHLHAKSFPGGALDDKAFADVPHTRRLVAGPKFEVEAGKGKITRDYVGPAAVSKAKASASSVMASPPKPKTGTWNQNKVTVSADIVPTSATPTYSITGKALGCTVDSSGEVSIGSTAGTITVRVTGSPKNYDEVTITITEYKAPTPPATPAPPAAPKATSVEDEATTPLVGHDQVPEADSLAIQPERRSTGGGPGTGPAVVQRERATVVQRVNVAPPGRIDMAVETLWKHLVVSNSADVEAVLQTLLMQRDHRQELKDSYHTTHKRYLEADLERLSWDNAIRAKRYLEFGTLRPADKIFIAIYGKLTDETTVMRVLKDIAGDRAQLERDFNTSYHDKYTSSTELPNGQTSLLGGALMQEMLWATFALRFRVLAILAFGAPRAADEVKIATVNGTNDAPLLFSALQREEPGKIATDFEASYKSPLKDYLSRETSLHTKARALMLIDPNVKRSDRLIETVRIGTSGYTTADFDFIMDAVQHADQDQLKAFRDAYARKDERLKSMTDLFGGMNAEQVSQFNALVGVGDNAGILGDPLVKRLREAGGTGSGLVYERLRDSTGEAYKAYKDAWNAATPLHTFILQNTTAQERLLLMGHVFTDFRARLDWVMTNPGHDDYILFLLTSFATPAERRALTTDAAFGKKLADLPTATQNRILLLFEPTNVSPEERAVWIDAAVKRETASGVGSVSNNAEALSDENRELQAARARATAGGKTPTPEEKAEIDRLANQTQSALTAFVQYRDQLEAAVSSAVDIAVGLLLTVATGGAASVELVLMAAARAAAASAMAKVVSRKLVMGDRFDVVGADGAAAFVTGAVDGMLNVVGPTVSKGLMGPALEETATLAAKSAAPQTFRQFASTTGAKMAEGGAVGSISGAVDAMAQDKTWADGFDRGMRKVVQSALAGGAVGAGMGAVPDSVALMVAGMGGLAAFEQLIDQLPDGEASAAKIDIKSPKPKGGTQRSTGPSVQRNFGLDFERHVETELLAGRIDPPGKMTYIIPGVHNQSGHGIDRIGVVVNADGSMTVYHFEMKYRLPPEPGGPAPDASLKKSESTGIVQSSQRWTADAIEKLCESDNPAARASREAARQMLADARGVKLTAVSELEVKSFLRKSIRAERVVAVPMWVKPKTLMKQIAALVRHGIDARYVKVNTPH